MAKRFNDNQNVSRVTVAVDVSQLQWTSKLVNKKKGVDLIMIAVFSNG